MSLSKKCLWLLNPLYAITKKTANLFMFSKPLKLDKKHIKFKQNYKTKKSDIQYKKDRINLENSPLMN